MGLTYSELLLDPAWKDKREYVLDTQGRYCNRCLSTSRLQVHHRYYRSGAMPWEYPDECFEVLCRPCHRKEHGLSDERIVSSRKRKSSSVGRVRKTVSAAPVQANPNPATRSRTNLSNPSPETTLTEEQSACRKWFWGLLVSGVLFGGAMFPGEPFNLISWLGMIAAFGYGGYFAEE